MIRENKEETLVNFLKSSWNFYDNVIQERFETCTRRFGNRVLDFVQWDVLTVVLDLWNG